MWKKVKGFLKSFLPIPANRYNQDINNIMELLVQSQRTTLSIVDTLADTRKETLSIVDTLADTRRETLSFVDTLADTKKTTLNVLDALADSRKTTRGIMDTLADSQETTRGIMDTLAESKKATDDIENTLLELKKTTKATQDAGRKVVNDIYRTRSAAVYSVSRILKRNRIEHLDCHLTMHCNLNCKGCSALSPLKGDQFADPIEFQTNLTKLHSLIGENVQQIHLLGGEPLLHPQVEQFAIISRSIFHDADIDFTTNGILIYDMLPSFWDVLRDQNVSIKFSRYPVNFDYDKMVEYIQQKGVYTFSVGGKLDYFRRVPLNATGKFNSYKSYAQCPYPDCVQLYEGKLYRCPYCAFVDVLNHNMEKTSQKGRFHIRPADMLDIMQAKSKEEVFDFLSDPIPFCRYCDTDHIDPLVPWSTSDRDIREWVDV